MNESQLYCGRPPEWIGVQIPLELVEAEHAWSNKYKESQSVIFQVAFTQGLHWKKERKNEQKTF